MYIADFSTGDDIKSLTTDTLVNIEGLAVRAKASVTNPSNTVESDYEANPLAYQMLAAANARPVDMEKLMDLNDIDASSRRRMSSSPMGAVLVPNEHNVVLAEDNKFGAAGGGYANVHIVNLKNKLKMTQPSCSPSSTPSTPDESRIVKGTERCRDIGDVCTGGDLSGDFRAVAGCAVTACVLLFIGLVALIAYTCTRKAALAIYVTTGCFSVCWVLLLAAWVRVDVMEESTYTCIFQDEALRGGLVMITGKLGYMTMESYSWAFTIFAWGMMTISLAAVLHHVISRACCPDRLAEKKEELENGEGGSTDSTSNAPDNAEK